MKKIIVLLLSLILLPVGLPVVKAQEDNIAEIESIELEIETLKKELRTLKRKNMNKMPLFLYEDDMFEIWLRDIKIHSGKPQRYEIIYEIYNDTDYTIEIQTREVSLDNLMIDDYVLMSYTIASGKVGHADMKMVDYSDDDLPPLEGLLELNLKFFNWDNEIEDIYIPLTIDLDRLGFK